MSATAHKSHSKPFRVRSLTVAHVKHAQASAGTSSPTHIHAVALTITRLLRISLWAANRLCIWTVVSLRISRNILPALSAHPLSTTYLSTALKLCTCTWSVLAFTAACISEYWESLGRRLALMNSNRKVRPDEGSGVSEGQRKRNERVSVRAGMEGVQVLDSRLLPRLGTNKIQRKGGQSGMMKIGKRTTEKRASSIQTCMGRGTNSKALTLAGACVYTATTCADSRFTGRKQGSRQGERHRTLYHGC